MIANFKLDQNVIVKLPNHQFSKTMMERVNSEPLFRKINTLLLTEKYIVGNILDLGAYIGDNSIPWALNHANNGVVYAIDPSQNNIDFINTVCLLNNITNIQTIKSVVSDKPEYLWTSDCIDHCSFVYNRNENKHKTEILSTTLDNLLLNNRITNIGYIHLDAEGMEERILCGSKELLRQNDSVLLTFEQHYMLDNIKSIFCLLDEFNYEIYLINEILAGCRYDCRNFIAFPLNSNNINYSTAISRIKNNFGDNSITKIDKNNFEATLK